jgi:hypothetical protein
VRDDVLVLDAADAALLVAALERLERLAVHRGSPIEASVVRVKRELTQYLTRVATRADARTRVPFGVAGNDDFVDIATAAQRIGISEDALRLACRSGRFAGVAQRHNGRWQIPAADVAADARRRSGRAG